MLVVGAHLGNAHETRSAEFECRFTTGPITIDGVAGDDAWTHAQVIDRFSLPWLGDPARLARSATRAKLLWDREYLYFTAHMDDEDLFADIKLHFLRKANGQAA